MDKLDLCLLRLDDKNECLIELCHAVYILFPEQWREWDRVKAVFCKVVGENIIRNFACLFKLRHTFTNFDEHNPVDRNVDEFVFIDDFLRYEVQRQLHVFKYC